MMNKNVLIAAATVVCLAMAPSLTHATPANARDPHTRTTTSVYKDFPQAKEINWVRQGEHAVATLELYGNKMTAVYNSKGKLLSTLIELTNKDVPFTTRKKLAQEYPDYEVYSAKEYLDKEGDRYFFILKKQESGHVYWLSIRSNGREGFSVLQKLNQRA